MSRYREDLSDLGRPLPIESTEMVDTTMGREYGRCKEWELLRVRFNALDKQSERAERAVK